MDGSGKIRRIVNGSSAVTEACLAHQLPDMAAAKTTAAGLISCFRDMTGGERQRIAIVRVMLKNAPGLIFVLREGQAEESGAHDSLAARNGLYAKMRQTYQTSVSWKPGAAKCAEISNSFHAKQLQINPPLHGMRITLLLSSYSGSCGYKRPDQRTFPYLFTSFPLCSRRP